MSEHLRRIREHMALEQRAMLVEAERARLFDHNGNRGSEVEHSVLRWLRARFAPDYTVSSGEIIDSFDTDADLKSRQQDGILHRNDAEANRFILPSGMRLVPIETVAAVVEVKLTLTKDEFAKADRAATETARLRLRGRPIGSYIPRDLSRGRERFIAPLTEDLESGIRVDDALLEAVRPTFAVFAFGGVSDIETIAHWLREAKTIRLVCCLEAGCALRAWPTHATVSFQNGALARFAECLHGALDRHEAFRKAFDPNLSAYASVDALPFWDETGFDPPGSYRPSDDERATRERMFEERQRRANTGKNNG